MASFHLDKLRDTTKIQLLQITAWQQNYLHSEGASWSAHVPSFKKQSNVSCLLVGAIAIKGKIESTILSITQKVDHGPTHPFLCCVLTAALMNTISPSLYHTISRRFAVTTIF